MTCSYVCINIYPSKVVKLIVTSRQSFQIVFVNLLGLEETVNQADTLAKDLQRRFETFDEKLHIALQPLITKYLYRHQ